MGGLGRRNNDKGKDNTDKEANAGGGRDEDVKVGGLLAVQREDPVEETLEDKEDLVGQGGLARDSHALAGGKVGRGKGDEVVERAVAFVLVELALVDPSQHDMIQLNFFSLWSVLTGEWWGTP